MRFSVTPQAGHTMDAKGWDERYSGAEFVWPRQPNRWVVQKVRGNPPGTALDLATGEGRNAIWLAETGQSMKARLTDVLDAGLALVSLDGITASPALSATAGTFAAVLGAAVVGPEPVGSAVAANQGRRLSLAFGTLTNTDTDNATDETITLDYTVVVLNSTGNNRGGARNNAVSLAFTGGTATANAPNVTIVEPTLQVVKTAVPTGGDAGLSLIHI